LTSKTRQARNYLAHVLSFPQQLVSEFHGLHAHQLPQTKHLIDFQHWRIGHQARLDTAWLRLQQSLTDQEPFVLQKNLLHEMLIVLGISGHLSPLLAHANGELSMRLQLLLMSDPSANWLQHEVAMQFCMSTATFRRHLAAQGQTFRAILDDVRMAHALNHLQTTHRRIEDIAQACGYSSASRFTTRFRQRFGLSPKVLRKAI
jgi:AraC-like DNA-binding protein